jgi:hypothetical protein
MKESSIVDRATRSSQFYPFLNEIGSVLVISAKNRKSLVVDKVSFSCKYQ